MVLNPEILVKVIHSKNAKTPDINAVDIEITPSSVKIILDVNTLTNTASITIPKKDIILPRNNNQYLSYFGNDNKVYFNDKIEIYEGYNGFLEQVFDGYLVDFEIKDDSIELNLQDLMYFWKIQPSIQFSYDTITLIDLLKSIGFSTKLPSTWDDTNIISFTLPKIRTNSFLTPAEILKLLKDNYNFYSYYLKGKFYCGHKYPLNTIDDQTDSSKVYIFAYPYFDFLDTQIGKTFYKKGNQTKVYPIIKNNLEKSYKNVQLISIVNVTQADNSKTTFYLTEDIPEVMQGAIPDKYADYHKIEINDVNIGINEGISLCESNFYNFPKDNYTGFFSTFGFPTLYPNDTVLLALNIINPDVVDITDTNLDLNYFLIEKVEKIFDEKGYFQTLYLDENYLSSSKINKN